MNIKFRNYVSELADELRLKLKGQINLTVMIDSIGVSIEPCEGFIFMGYTEDTPQECFDNYEPQELANMIVRTYRNWIGEQCFK